ncbi:MAG: hypothetical protein PHD56_01070 [Anaerostipes sp.]|nr:hypothetical protein [Anaerostipes sp.]
MKLRKTTKIVIIISWVLFFCACFFIFIKLNQVKESKVTNEKIFHSKHTVTATTASEKEVTKDQVIAFMKNYYQWLEKGNESKVVAMVEDPSIMKKKQSVRKLKQYIEAYKNINFTVEDGLDEKSFIVYVTYDTKIKDIRTLVPALAQYYVKMDKESFVIYNNEKHYSDDMKDLVKETLRKDKIQEMIQTTNKAYDQALKHDKELRKFFTSGESR